MKNKKYEKVIATKKVVIYFRSIGEVNNIEISDMYSDYYIEYFANSKDGLYDVRIDSRFQFLGELIYLKKPMTFFQFLRLSWLYLNRPNSQRFKNYLKQFSM